MDAGATEVQDRRDAEQASERERLQQRDEEKAASDRDEKLLRELEGGVQKSVRNLFLVLCGAADGDDKFTGYVLLHHTRAVAPSLVMSVPFARWKGRCLVFGLRGTLSERAGSFFATCMFWGPDAAGSCRAGCSRTSPSS